MRSMRYRITTLGCRVNHAETRDLESVLLARGFVGAVEGAYADLEVIHSCSVTGSAAAKSRQAIRRAARRARSLESSGCQETDLSLNRNGHESLHVADQDRQRRCSPIAPTFSKTPQIIVSGCYGSTDPDDAALLAGGPDHVIQHESDDGTTLAERFALRVDQWLSTQQAPRSLRKPGPASCRQTIRPLPVVTPRPAAGSHVRAELKIQDGCDAHCTFCIIPRIRRTLRSKAIRDAVSEATTLVDLGHREIVLTGIFIGGYGHETALRRKQSRAGTTPLADLLDAVAQVPGLSRLRVSSMEPGDVSEPLLDAMVANQHVVVPHLHLPLQSGSDTVLRSMNRQYRVGDYLAMVDKVNAALTLPAPRERTSLHVRSDPPNEFGGSYESECRPAGPYGARSSLQVRSDSPNEFGGSYESECRPAGPYGALKRVPYGAEKRMP
jgi:threonylcarbamoyladenosine tRNA methylthiotransferase MtaB